MSVCDCNILAMEGTILDAVEGIALACRQLATSELNNGISFSEDRIIVTIGD